MGEIAWCANQFAVIKDGGLWAVPRSGLIFRRDGSSLILQDKLPGYDRAEQECDFLCIKSHFADAGIRLRRSSKMATLIIKGKQKDFPYADLVKAAAELRRTGKLVRAKFTCSHCGERVMGVEMEPKQICPSCGHDHDFAASGGNYATLQVL